MASNSKDFREGPDVSGVVPSGYERDEHGNLREIHELFVRYTGHRSHTELADDPLAQELICATYAKIGRIVPACAMAGVSPTTVKRLADSSPEFRAALYMAQQAYGSRVLAEVQRRALEGVTKPVFYKGEVVGTTQEYSDRLLELELKRVDPEWRAMVDGPRGQGTTVNVAVTATSIAAALSQDSLDAPQAALDPRTMSQAERDALRALMAARRATAAVGTGSGSEAARALGSGGVGGGQGQPILDVAAVDAATEPTGVAPEASTPAQDGRKR